ncbi:MAG: biopolymer transporter ExbD [Ottowia sp.]|nr:biopolymer transporter ExbD [Ottowia sp.]
MSTSLRAKRMARNHRRLRQQPRLNLVALMDIFTILVLFLMVNNGDVEVLQADRNIDLPESVSEQRPELAVTIKVSAADISVGGTRVALVEEALAQPQQTLAPLATELARLAALAPPLGEGQQERGRPIIIMGTRDMPYDLLKRIMATCAASDFRDVSLAVNSVAAAGSPAPAPELMPDSVVTAQLAGEGGL